jgi:hypothetical protein
LRGTSDVVLSNSYLTTYELCWCDYHALREVTSPDKLLALEQPAVICTLKTGIAEISSR